MTSSLRLLLLIAAVLVGACAPWPVQVTSALSGVVIDAETQQPVVGATVYLSAFPDNTARSSAKGEFVIAPIRRWQVAVFGGDQRSGYFLVAEAQGYRRSQQSWEVGDDRPQTIRLHLDGEK